MTGGTGYVGSHTALALIEAGHKVVLYDNLVNSDQSILECLEKITSTKVNFIEGDIRSSKKLSKAIKEFKIEAVIHFAGLKAVGESTEDPLDYYDNNVNGSISLIKAMQENHVKKIVFSSSATVYGHPEYLPYDENHPTKPINPYGRTKLFIEEILRDVCASDSKWSSIVLRFFNPVGAHESGLIGESPKGAPNNLMPYIVKVASGKLKSLKVFGNDFETHDGTGGRDYIHVMDLAEGHLAALIFLNNNYGWHVINLGGGKSTTVLELIKIFEKTNSKKIYFEISERREGDISISLASTQKASLDIGWRAKRSIENACRTAWNREISKDKI